MLTQYQRSVAKILGATPDRVTAARDRLGSREPDQFGFIHWHPAYYEIDHDSPCGIKSGSTVVGQATYREPGAALQAAAVRVVRLSTAASAPLFPSWRGCKSLDHCPRPL